MPVRARETSLVLTLMAPDRPGLVEAVSEIIALHDANWEASHMAHLAGQFAGILRITAAEEGAAALAASLRELPSRVEGLSLQLAMDEGDDPHAFDALGAVWELEVLGQDHPGIVRALSHALAEAGANVEELETHCAPAPVSGERLFQARARVRPPAHLTMAELQATLEPLAADLMVDLDVHEPKEP